MDASDIAVVNSLNCLSTSKYSLEASEGEIITRTALSMGYEHYLSLLAGNESTLVSCSQAFRLKVRQFELQWPICLNPRPSSSVLLGLTPLPGQA
jgi:hypothetical protein